MLKDPDICLVYPSRPYPEDAKIPRGDITRILDAMQGLRKVDTTIYLRTASINIFNGMVSLTFSCDGSHWESETRRTNPQLFAFHRQSRPPPLWKPTLQTTRLDARFAQPRHGFI